MKGCSVLFKEVSLSVVPGWSLWLLLFFLLIGDLTEGYLRIKDALSFNGKYFLEGDNVFIKRLVVNTQESIRIPTQRGGVRGGGSGRRRRDGSGSQLNEIALIEGRGEEREGKGKGE